MSSEQNAGTILIKLQRTESSPLPVAKNKKGVVSTEDLTELLNKRMEEFPSGTGLHLVSYFDRKESTFSLTQLKISSFSSSLLLYTKQYKYLVVKLMLLKMSENDPSVIDDPSSSSVKISVKKAADHVQLSTGGTVHDMQNWCTEYLNTGQAVNVKRQKLVPQFRDLRQLSEYHVLELYACFMAKKNKGETTSVVALASHLNSQARPHSQPPNTGELTVEGPGSQGHVEYDAGLRFSNVDQPKVTYMNYKVPQDKPKLFADKPSAPELKEAVFKELERSQPMVVLPPYLQLMKEQKGQWGPPDSDGFSLVWNAQYTAPEVAIELMWADGKNHLANPKNFTADRSLATTVKQLRDRWYNEPTTTPMIEHCEKVMMEQIKLDHSAFDKHKEAHLWADESDSIFRLNGMPDAETLKNWKKLVEMDKYRENRISELNEFDTDFQEDTEEAGMNEYTGEDVEAVEDL